MGLFMKVSHHDFLLGDIFGVLSFSVDRDTNWDGSGGFKDCFEMFGVRFGVWYI